MTRKHYKIIAESLKRTRPGSHSVLAGVALEEELQWNNTVTDLARVLSSTNPRFNRARFVEACGGLF